MCQSCHWWLDVPERTVTAMTTFLLLLALIALAELVVGVRFLRADRPLTQPASHPDWGSGMLPSRPYSSTI